MSELCDDEVVQILEIGGVNVTEPPDRTGSVGPAGKTSNQRGPLGKTAKNSSFNSGIVNETEVLVQPNSKGCQYLIFFVGQQLNVFLSYKTPIKNPAYGRH